MDRNLIFFLIAFFVIDTIVVAAIVIWAVKRKANGAPPSNSFGGMPSSSSESPFSSIAPTNSSSEIRDLLRRGQKIQAIKIYRERNGGGLKEAKDAVEAIERQM